MKYQWRQAGERIADKCREEHGPHFRMVGTIGVEHREECVCEARAARAESALQASQIREGHLELRVKELVAERDAMAKVVSELRLAVKRMDVTAQRETKMDGGEEIITGYRFKTGAFHALLGLLSQVSVPHGGHVHCNGDNDGLCCDKHMDGNPERVVHDVPRERGTTNL